jgi:hypothetical protein
VANLTPDQLRTRERVETLIRLMAPGLNIVLAVGERVSRFLEPDDPDYYPIQSPRERSEANGGADAAGDGAGRP